MSTLAVILFLFGLLGFVACIVLLVMAVIKRKPKKILLKGLLACLIVCLVGVFFEAAAEAPSGTAASGVSASMSSAAPSVDAAEVFSSTPESSEEGSLGIDSNESENQEKKEPTETTPTETQQPEQEPVETPQEPQDTEEMVWIPTNGGTKYHTNSSCSKMKNPQEVTISQAKSRGFTPCGRCY